MASLLFTALRTAENRLLGSRQFRWIPVTEACLEDKEGVVHLPRGQHVSFKVVHCTTERLLLLHTCVESTKAEIDFVIRACTLYRAIRVNSTAVTIVPVIVTLCMGEEQQHIAAVNGVCVSIAGTLPPEIEREQQQESGSQGSSSRFAHRTASTPALIVAHSLQQPTRTASLSSSSSSLSLTDSLPSLARSRTASDISASTKPAVETNESGVARWRIYLVKAGFDEPLVTSLSIAFIQHGIWLPANPADLPWAELKRVEGLKLGNFSRLKKFATQT